MVNEPGEPYLVTHPVTETFAAAMDAVGRGELAKAVELLRREPRESPNYAMALGNLALVLFRMDQLDEAETIAVSARNEIAARGCPHPASAVQFLRAYPDTIARRGRPAEALHWYEHAVQQAGELAQARPDAAAAIEREIAHTLNAWGASLRHLGRAGEAVEKFFAAREIYRKYPNQQWSGLSETLTNLAETCLDLRPPDPTRAERALLEALDIARQEGNADQTWRSQIKLIQLRSKAVALGEWYGIFEAAARDAERQHRWSTAYLRRCIEAQVAAEEGHIPEGLHAIQEAMGLEGKLDRGVPYPAQLRLTQVKLMAVAGAAATDVLSVLIDGAFLWFERLRQPLTPDDFKWTAAATHDHFRLLARKLLDADRVEEAAFAFEAGRALAHAAETDPEFVRSFFAGSNPFDPRTARINTERITAARAALGADGAVLVPAVLPPEFVLFVLTAEGVSVAGARYAHDQGRTALEELDRAIQDIPHQLQHQERTGPSTIPAPLRDAAGAAARLIGHRAVRSVFPHATLHSVPWRAVLREAGMPWRQLPCAVEFSLLLRGSVGFEPPAAPSRAVALGHGSDMGINFVDEARDFAGAFGDRGHFMPSCQADDVRSALSATDAAVLISCHGRDRERGVPGVTHPAGIERPPEFALQLQPAGGAAADADDERFISDVMPDMVRSQIVFLSACWSGVYSMSWGDYPVGAGPMLLRAGARYCVVCRFPVRAVFARQFAVAFSRRLADGASAPAAFAGACEDTETAGADLWRDLACLELLARPKSDGTTTKGVER